MKKKSLFALVAMVVFMATGIAFAVARFVGPADLSAAGDPTAWSIYQSYDAAVPVAGAGEYAFSGVNINLGINSDDNVNDGTTAAGQRRALTVFGDFGVADGAFPAAAPRIFRGLVTSGDNGAAAPALTNYVSVDKFVFNTISTTTIRPVFRFDAQPNAAVPTSSVDIRILDSNGNNVLERVVHLNTNPAVNIDKATSVDVPVTLNVPATVEAAPVAYTLELSWAAGVADGGVTAVGAKRTMTYPILVDRVAAQDADLTTSAFINVNNDADGDFNNALGQRVALHHFTTPQTAPVTTNMGLVPNVNLDGTAANIDFFVRNDGRTTMRKTTGYDGLYSWTNNAGTLRAYRMRTLLGVGTVSTDLFTGFVGRERIAVAAGTWAPKLANGWETTTYNWTSAALPAVATMAFDARTDVANVMIRNAVLANNAAVFNRTTYFPSMDVNVTMAQAQGVTGHVSAPSISAKNVAPVAFEIPVPNPARDDEVYVYPMQVTLRVRAADVDRVWGTTSNKWRTIQNKFANLNATGGLKAFLDAIGPQKVVGGQTYALANVAPAADLPKYFQVRNNATDSEYYISFFMVIADMAKPTGLNDVVAVNNMFIVYDGQKNNVLVDPIYAGEPTTTTPTPTSGPTPTAGPTATPTPGSSSSSGGCSAFGFAPMALLLLAPLALLRKRG